MPIFRHSWTDRVYILDDVLKGWVRAEVGEDVFVVEQRVDEVGVVVHGIAQTRVYDLQHHPDHLLQYSQVLHLDEMNNDNQ